nr:MULTISPECIES: Ig-like domain-containing protein [unclassified Pseudomonas]
MLLGVGGLALLGGAYALGRNNSNSSNSSESNAAKPPVQPIFVDKPSINSIYDDVGNITGNLTPGSITDDTTPTLSGEGTPGNTVIVLIDNKVVGEAIVGVDGLWRFTPATPLGEGSHEIVIRERDPAGNQSNPSGGIEIIVDTQAPGQAAISSVIDNLGNITGPITSGTFTDDSQPEFHGTAEAGSTIIIYSDGVEIGRAPVSSDGNWTFTPRFPISDGSYNITAAAMDVAGNIGLPSTAFELEVNTGRVYTAPTISGVVDNIGLITGNLSPGDTSDDTRPTVSGNGEVGSTVMLYSNGAFLGTTVVAVDGMWSFTVPFDLHEGLNNLTVTSPDAGVTAYSGGSSFPLIIDTTAPAAATNQLLTDDVGSVTGPVQSGDTTDDAMPTFEGNAEPESTVIIYDNSVEIGRVLAGIDGRWSFTPSTPLPDGAHSFHSVVQDPAGNQGLPSASTSFFVDTGIAVISIDNVIDDAGSITGPLAHGGVTDDTSPTLNGNAIPGATVNIYDNNAQIGSALVDALGNWTFTPAQALTEGAHSFTATVVTAAGGESSTTTSFDLIIDITAPGTPGQGTQPGIDDVHDNVGLIQGTIINGGTTDDATPTLSGGGQQPGETITIRDAGQVIGSVVVDNGGNWSYTPSPGLNDGSHAITITITDAAGNVSQPSDPYTIIVDTVAPAISNPQQLLDNVGAVTGPISSGDTTDDATPTFEGKAEPASTVIIYDNNLEIGRVSSAADGSWSFTPSTPLPDGAHSLSSVVEDSAGNRSVSSASINFVVDTSNVVISIDDVIDNAGSFTGPLAHGGVTDDTTPTLNGTAVPGATVNIYDNNAQIGSAPVDALGNWTFTPVQALTEGAHNFTATVVTAAAGESAATSPFALVIDTTAPDTPGQGTQPGINDVNDNVGIIQGIIVNGGTTDDATPTLSGSGQQPGETITIRDAGQVIGSAVVDNGGDWTFTPSPALNDGSHAITITITDAAGNVSQPSDPYTIIVDTVAPAISNPQQLLDNVGAVTGQINNGDTTDDATPTFKGKAEPGSTVIIYDNSNEIGRVPADTNGNWSFTPSNPLYDGGHSFQTVVEDIAGNKSNLSAALEFTIDTTPSILTTKAVISTMGKDSGYLDNDFVTNDGTAGRLIQGSLSAAIAAGEKVQVSVDAGTSWLDALVHDNSWSFVDKNEHSTDWTIESRVVNAATGFAGVADTQIVRFIADAPNAPTTVIRSGDNVSVDITGTNAQSGDTLYLVVNGTKLPHTLSNNDIISGLVNFNVPSGSTGTITSFVVDSAGNSSDLREITYSGVEDFSTGFDEINFGETKAFGLFNITNNSSIPLHDIILNFAGGEGTKFEGLVVGGDSPDGSLTIPNFNSTIDLHMSANEFEVKFVSGQIYSGPVPSRTEITTYKFFDSSGNIVGEQVLDTTNKHAAVGANGKPDYSSAANADYVKFTAPAGEYFTSIQITSTGRMLNGVFDDFVISSNGAIYPQATNQIIVEAMPFYGSDENNTFSVSDVSLLTASQTEIHGEKGIDTLVLTGQSQVLDMTALGEKISSLEIIDLTGTGNNTLKLSLNDVLNNGELNLFSDDGTTQMMIKGSAGDVVDLQGLVDSASAGNWANQGTITTGGVVYDVYRHSSLDAELLTQQGITTNLV